MITGKIPYLEAVNGSTVLLPCKYASCIGIEDLYFRWSFNDTDPQNKVRTSRTIYKNIANLIWLIYIANVIWSNFLKIYPCLDYALR